MVDIFDTQSIPEIFYHDFITLTSLLAASVSRFNVPNFGMKSVISDIWPIFNDLWRHVWRNFSDIFYIRSIPETYYYHLDTLVTGYCVPWLHVKQTQIGIDKWRRTPVFHLLTVIDYLCHASSFFDDRSLCLTKL